MRYGKRRRRKGLKGGPLLFVLLFPLAVSAGATLPPLISDNMVLQRSAATRVWGRADPGEPVRVSVAGAEAATVAGTNGLWEVRLDLAAAAAGPFDMTVRGREKLRVRDVLIGEVWLAGGQSNMEMPFKNWGGVFGREALYGEALDRPIRVFRVPHGNDIRRRLDECGGRWEIPTRGNMPGFAAVPFSCAVGLNRALAVPVGMVDNSNGGTTALNWTGRDWAVRDPEDARLIGEQEHNARLRDAFTAWCGRNRCRAESRYRDEHFLPFVTQEVGWAETALPAKMPRGVIWFRRRITLPEKMRQNRITLTGAETRNLTFQLYYGGVKHYGGLYGARDLRTVPIDLSLDGKTFPAGEFILFLRVISPMPDGEILPGRLRLDLWNGHQTVDLSGPWQSLTETRFPPLDPQTVMPEPFVPVTAHTAYYNFMLYPLRRMTFRGMLWYQGCNDAAQWQAYERRLKNMIGCWRETLQAPELPFYLCQLHGYGRTRSQPGEDTGIARIRVAHRRVAREVPHSGMIVTTDFSESECHSRHKIGLGFRLANLLLAETYGKPVAYSGPVFRDARREGAALVLSFGIPGKPSARGAGKGKGKNQTQDAEHRTPNADVADTGLKAAAIIREHTTSADHGMRAYTRLSPPESPLEGFEIQDASGAWFWAHARIAGETVVVSHPQVTVPVRVRYNWGNLVFGNLYGSNGLPAGPFEWGTGSEFRLERDL